MENIELSCNLNKSKVAFQRTPTIPIGGTVLEKERKSSYSSMRKDAAVNYKTLIAHNRIERKAERETTAFILANVLNPP